MKVNYFYENIRNTKQVVSLLGFQAEGEHGLKKKYLFFNSKVAAYYKIKINGENESPRLKNRLWKDVRNYLWKNYHISKCDTKDFYSVWVV